MENLEDSIQRLEDEEMMEDRMTNKKSIPVDSYRVDENAPGSGEYVAATAAGRELRGKILSNESSRRAYDQMTAAVSPSPLSTNPYNILKKGGPSA